MILHKLCLVAMGACGCVGGWTSNPWLLIIGLILAATAAFLKVQEEWK